MTSSVELISMELAVSQTGVGIRWTILISAKGEKWFVSISGGSVRGDPLGEFRPLEYCSCCCSLVVVEVIVIEVEPVDVVVVVVEVVEFSVETVKLLSTGVDVVVVAGRWSEESLLSIGIATPTPVSKKRSSS